jgi:hypothetical protein
MQVYLFFSISQNKKQTKMYVLFIFTLFLKLLNAQDDTDVYDNGEYPDVVLYTAPILCKY